MSTGNTNPMRLSPAARITPTRVMAPHIRTLSGVGHFRSHPAELETTYRPAFEKPVAPTEKPMGVTTTALPLEPAREPVPGASPE
jgi:hypothetical protein